MSAITDNPSDITYQSARLGGSADGEGMEMVDWGLWLGDYPDNNWDMIDSGGWYYYGSNSEVYGGLTPSHHYVVQLRTDQFGSGDVKDFWTAALPAPTNVQASDGTYTDKVRVTWSGIAGMQFRVYRNGVDVSGLLSNVFTWDDTTAPAPSITPGTADASDGTSSTHVTLSLSGESASNGSTASYTVTTVLGGAESAASSADTGYRSVGSLTYQWQRSAGDSDASYSTISGATTDPYSDTGAPDDGSGRYYKCVLSASGASSQTSTADRGYRGGQPMAQRVRGSKLSSFHGHIR